MPDTNQLPLITGYTIQGAAGRCSRSGLALHDVQATAWAALGAVTAARWDRLELRQRRAGVFELEGFSGRDRRSGIYILTLGEVPPDPLASPGRMMSSGAEDAPLLAPRFSSHRESWAEWIPGAAGALTRSELAASVSRELGERITEAVIEEWEREGVLPIPMGDPAMRSYPEAVREVVLLLVSLDQAGRAYLDILEVLRNKARALHANITLATAAPSGG